MVAMLFWAGVRFVRRFFWNVGNCLNLPRMFKLLKITPSWNRRRPNVWFFNRWRQTVKCMCLYTTSNICQSWRSALHQSILLRVKILISAMNSKIIPIGWRRNVHSMRGSPRKSDKIPSLLPVVGYHQFRCYTMRENN